MMWDVHPPDTGVSLEIFWKALYRRHQVRCGAPDCGWLEVRPLGIAGMRPLFFPSIQWDLAPAMVRHLDTRQGTISFGVALRRSADTGTKDGVRCLTAVWADYDGKDHPGGKAGVLPQLQEALPEALRPSIIVDSGHGYHAYWILDETWEIESAIDVPKAEGILKGLAREAHGDGAAADLSRVLRCPTSTNWKDLDYPVQTTVIHWDPRHTVARTALIGRYWNVIRATVDEADRRAARVSRAVSANERARMVAQRKQRGALPAEEQARVAAILGTTDTCLFFDYVRKTPQVAEPLWYAALTNLAAIGGDAAHAMAHTLSQPDPRYSPWTTDRKWEQATRNVERFGPHTCQWVAEHGFVCPRLVQCRAHHIRAPITLARQTRASDTTLSSPKEV